MIAPSSIIKTQHKYNSHPMYCEFCGKCYKTIVNLNKHILLCEVVKRSINKHTDNPIDKSINEKLPSQENMYKIIETLTIKYNKLEEKMEELQKWVDKKKKKINIIDWLNENDKIQPTYEFDSIFDKINITQKTIDYLFTNNFYDTVNEILVNFYNSNPEIPLFAFNQKSNIIYVFNKNNDQQSSWKEISKDQVVDFLDKLQTKITRCLKEWKKIHEDKVRNDNKFSELYSKTIIKIMDVKFNNETTITRYKSLLYNKIKVDMKNLIEYEYEF
uniref:Uncharacterized protein n=1 Tax=viral metagenome TaxID=1070528 RepID=A0A6C0IFP0_9ZZZZ